MALQFYLCHDCLQNHVDMLDGKEDTEPMLPEVIGSVKISLAAKRIFLMLNARSGHTNGTTKNGKSYLMQFCLI